jgi:DNA mismatch repair protein MutL
MTLIPNHKSILVSNEDNIDNIILSNTLICEKLPLKDDNFFKESLSIHVKYDNFSTRIIGQLLQTYILASDNQGLIIIDQHVAHERILYERILNDIQKQRIIAQRLLVPMTFELTPSQQVVLHRIRTELIASGFEVEEFGGHTIAVKSVPASLSQDDSRLLILDILDRLIEDSQGRHLLDWQRTMAASLACRTAIKANSPLSMEKMERLMEELGQTNFPHSCPHGRPIQIRVAWEEIARRFQRA